MSMPEPPSRQKASPLILRRTRLYLGVATGRFPPA
jgi:hypothetical protein